MPRLSTELRAQRRQHVLASAWRCFSRDGFHETSLDDIIAATGISSGAVYRYFRGKDDLVDAAAEESLALIRDVSKIAMHAWAEALRRPELEARTRAFYLDVRGHLTELARRWRTAGHLAPDAEPEHVATALLTLMPGLIVTRHLVGTVSAHELTEGLSMLGTAATTR
ncbi:TetR/AcrR family transcriptional regulator [Pseudonocardia sp. Cha107L01]|uniref:TetR/AcrR family transcriptional regulator n=1 Tax=Pseudonocardia sp. Cha107L01 TaxID=3457576 RepID=UPI00403E3FF4